jgi:hypothetical protein
MLKRFILATVAFIGLIVPGSFALALLAAPAKPAPLPDPPGCERAMKDAGASVAAWQTRLHKVSAGDSTQMCKLTRLYFLEMVKARAVTALCRHGSDRERLLGRFDADVDHINNSIATLCR